MKPARLHCLEARLPAGSSAGICLFCAAVMAPTLMIAVVLRMMG